MDIAPNMLSTLMPPDETIELAKQIFVSLSANPALLDSPPERLAELALRRAGAFALILNDTILRVEEERETGEEPRTDYSTQN